MIEERDSLRDLQRSLTPTGMCGKDVQGINVCAWCGKAITLFKDALSVAEYKISGQCQECQDEVYG